MQTLSPTLSPQEKDFELDSKTMRVRARILPFLVITIILFVGIFIYKFYQDEQRRIAETHKRRAEVLQNVLRAEMQNDVGKLSAALEVIVRDPLLLDAFRGRDLDRILTRARPLFDRLKNQHQVTHFYFHKPDMVNLVRVHKAEKGDLIDRITIQTALKDGVPSAGLEQGPTGNPVLRYVYPWHSDIPTRKDANYYPNTTNAELVGFVELGIEFEDMAKRISKLVGMELIVSVDKKFLDRQQWESRNQKLGRQSAWNDYPDTVVVDKTFSTAIPQPVSAAIAKSFKQIDDSLIFQKGTSTYQGIFIPFQDINGRVLGHVIALNNISSILDISKRTQIEVAIVCSLIGIIVIIFFYILLGKVQQTLQNRTIELLESYNNLRLADEVVKKSTQTMQRNEAQLKSLQEIMRSRGLVKD